MLLTFLQKKMVITKFRFGLQCLIKGNYYYYAVISSLLLSFFVVVIETFSFCLWSV